MPDLPVLPSLASLWLPALFGCGDRLPGLPPRLADPAEIRPLPGLTSRGAQLLRDRSLGRTGLACADCHALNDSELRPGPPLRSRAGASPPAINRCIERYLARPALEPQPLGDLVAALEASAPATEPAPVEATPAALYDAACRHCHEDGPGPAVVGCAWRPVELERIVRGDPRTFHPAGLMPPFPRERLGDSQMRLLSGWLAETANGVSCRVGKSKIE